MVLNRITQLVSTQLTRMNTSLAYSARRGAACAGLEPFLHWENLHQDHEERYKVEAGHSFIHYSQFLIKAIFLATNIRSLSLF